MPLAFDTTTIGDGSITGGGGASASSHARVVSPSVADDTIQYSYSPNKTLNDDGDTLTFGSTLGDDSFALVSVAGYNDSEYEDGSSSLSYDPYTGQSQCVPLLEKNRTDSPSVGSKGSRKSRTKRLPRFNREYAKERALIEEKRKTEQKRHSRSRGRGSRFGVELSLPSLSASSASSSSQSRSAVTARTVQTEKTAPTFDSAGSKQERCRPTTPKPQRPPPADVTPSPPPSSSKDRRRRRTVSHREKLEAERNYWKDQLTGCVVQHGAVHAKTADCLMCLGHAHMRCKEFTEALSVYKSTVRIRRKIRGDSNLMVARSLDKVGLAASRCATETSMISFPPADNLDWALVALNEAFRIRYDSLGPHHTDTVETLNNIAGVHLHRNEMAQAKEAYIEVLTVRMCIFGPFHPSVAVTAHALGGVYMRSTDLENAMSYYGVALNIYTKAMKLKEDHPTVSRILRDVAGVERIMVSLGYR